MPRQKKSSLWAPLREERTLAKQILRTSNLLFGLHQSVFKGGRPMPLLEERAHITLSKELNRLMKKHEQMARKLVRFKTQ